MIGGTARVRCSGGLKEVGGGEVVLFGRDEAGLWLIQMLTAAFQCALSALSALSVTHAPANSAPHNTTVDLPQRTVQVSILRMNQVPFSEGKFCYQEQV